MPSLQSFLRMTPCSQSLSVWKMAPNDIVRDTLLLVMWTFCFFDVLSLLFLCYVFLCCFFLFSLYLFTAIGRTLIPRYFRSIFEGGATELFYVLKHPKESFHSNFVSLDCDQCTMVTQNGKPMFTQVNVFFLFSYLVNKKLIFSSSSDCLSCGLGVCWGSPVSRIYVWWHDENQDMALQHQATQRSFAKEHFGYACKCEIKLH